MRMTAMTRIKFLFLAVISIIMLTGCLPFLLPEYELEGVNVEEFITQTADASRLTSAEEINLTTPTSRATDTRVAPHATATPANIETPVVTEGPGEPTLTSKPAPCYQAEVVEDVALESGAVLQPSERFTKTWTLKNIGSCNWAYGTRLIFDYGEQMDAPDSIALNMVVKPGEVIEVSVNMKAPNQLGVYESYWQLSSYDNKIFGVGETATAAFGFRVVVSEFEFTDPNVIYEFLTNYCDAEWRTNVIRLECPISDLTSKAGAMLRVDSPLLEDGYEDNEPALVMVPSQGDGGFISGKFPPFEVKQGDRFRAVIGCLYQAPQCNVTLKLSAVVASTMEEVNIGTWTEFVDRNYQFLNIDLSAFADETVEFVLYVSNNGDSLDDRVFWLRPQILREIED